jgi:HEAT repeat protein
LTALALLMGVSVLALSVGGCRTSESDVQRWTTTAQGPSRLVAVVTHDKFSPTLRTQAALALVSMAPRDGQRIGISKLVEALSNMGDPERKRAVAALVPHLLEGIAKTPRTEDGKHVDESVPYKDAAYALLSAEGGSLIEDPQMESEVKRALAGWVSTDFEARIDEPSQMFGVEQMMHTLGHAGVTDLPKLITPTGEKIDRVVGLVAQLGDSATKLAASKRLSARGHYMASSKWAKEQESVVREQNAKAKLAPTADQLKKQIQQYQDEQLLRLYATMSRIGKAPTVDFLLDEGENRALDEKRRATALAALKGNIDPKNRRQVERLLDLAGGKDTPDKVRDVALQRIAELPRKLVVDRLYALFDDDNWKVRWVAAETILKMSDQSHLAGFMKRLGKVEHMALTEALRYGDLMGKLEGKQSPRALVARYAAKRQPASVRVSALGFYFDNGKRSELEAIRGYQEDREKIPGCAENAKDCEWKCAFQGKLREIETIGEFVEYCVAPAVAARKQTRSPKKRSNKQK